MQLILVTGLSGSGKSIAVRQLEDSGYYCVDNLPIELLPLLVKSSAAKGIDHLAVAIDARSSPRLPQAQSALNEVKNLGASFKILFLTATTEELIQRYSETRRVHPLLNCRGEQHTTLQEAIQLERAIMEPMSEYSSVIDTTKLLPGQLKLWIQKFIDVPSNSLTLAFESFAFKYGVPAVSDLVFDARCLPNPYYVPELRPLSGMDKPVADYLASFTIVQDFVSDISDFLHKWIPSYAAQSKRYLTISIGCTGGQHRSVYIAERLAEIFRNEGGCLVRHRRMDGR